MFIKQFHHQVAKSVSKVSLRTVLTVPFVLKHIGVQYVYESSDADQISAAKGEERFLTAAAIAGLPPELVRDLKQGILSVDLDLIAEQVEKIRFHNGGLADAIAQCIDNFEYDNILQLIKSSDRQGIDKFINS